MLLCGWSVQRQQPDYGVDLAIHTYSSEGEIENGYISVQVKGTDHLRRTPDNQRVVCRVARSHLRYWHDEPYPVMLALYDARAEIAYWLHLQSYLAATPEFDPATPGQTMTLYIPEANRLTRETVFYLAALKNAALQRIKGVTGIVRDPSSLYSTEPKRKIVLATGILFEDLEALLFQHGFHKLSEGTGTHLVYQEDSTDTTVVLPKYQPTESVRPLHVNTLKKLLIEKGLADESTLAQHP